MIARDGAYVSLWQEMPVYQTQRKVTAKHVYDVIIVGGGMTGLTTALSLQKAGKNCLVVEAHNIGFGTTGGTTAHLNTLLDTPYSTIIKNFGLENAKLVCQAAHEAIDLIRNNINQYSIDCDCQDASAYLFAQDQKQNEELDDILDACQKVQLAVHYEDQLHAPFPYTKVMAAGNQAKFHPLKYLYAIAHQFEEAGGSIKQYCKVTNIHAEGERVKVATESGNFKSRTLIYATHIPPGINLIHLRCSPMRSYALAAKLNDENYPAGLFYDMENPYHYYRTQVVDGERYLIAGGKDHKTAHEPNTEQRFRALEAHVRKFFNIREVTYQWSSQYYEPVDGLPYIGHLPGYNDNVYVATGFGGNGMTYSHVSALLFTELLTGRESNYKDLFSPTRIKPIAGFADFIEHNTDVVRHFVGKWFATEDVNEAIELAPGEGKVAIYKGSLIALSKDSDHTLHAVGPACTHMKCSVAWNLAEQSWDCPCHGARYSPDGKVLNGPASKDLERVELRSLHPKEK
jgi:glycine/D-amino acid oxidase-like deaminating enzyme/nitrite reductase/ring-hydroxylating ferredoxin subunit